ncbi:unnamed protein product [Musa acuminata subsp. burmannicoides]
MGTGTEVWNPESSTVLQALLSLQALVLNEKPYFNEAGFDEEIGKVDGDRNSITRMVSYSHANQCYTYYASHLSILRHSSRSILHKGHIIFSMSARLIWKVHRLVTLTSMEGLPAKLVPLDSKSRLENFFPELISGFNQNGTDCSQFLN